LLKVLSLSDITWIDPDDRNPDVFSSGPQKIQALDYPTSPVKREVLTDTRGYSPAYSEVLRGNRTVSSKTLSAAMDKAQQWQAPLGDVLIAQGGCVSHKIYDDFSQSLQLPLLDISTLGPTPEITTER